MKNEKLEEGKKLNLDFKKLHEISKCPEPVLPGVVQHSQTNEVLILAYLSREALEKSLNLGEAVFYSTSRKELWHKGSTSGDFLKVEEVLINCEQNSVVFKVTPKGQGVCHTQDDNGKKRKSCYYRKIKSNSLIEFIE